jgi:hypothetical protein
MTDAQREDAIAEYARLMAEAWASKQVAIARFYCRLYTKMILGRSPEQVARMEKERGVA